MTTNSSSLALHPHFSHLSIFSKSSYDPLELAHDPKFPAVAPPRVAQVETNEKWQYEWIRVLK